MEIDARATGPDGAQLDVACQPADAAGTWVLSVGEAAPGSEVTVTVQIEEAGWVGAEWQPLDPGVVVEGGGSNDDPLSLRAGIGPAGEERTFAVHGRPGPIVLVVRLRAGPEPPPPANVDEEDERPGLSLDSPRPRRAEKPRAAPPPPPPPPPPASSEQVPEGAPAPIVPRLDRPGDAPHAIEPTPEPRGGAGPGRAIALALVITALVVAVGWWLVPPGPSAGRGGRGAAAREVALVPDCYGLSEDSAEGELARAGLDWTVYCEPSDTVVAGRVVSQQPPPGTSVSTGESVQLVVSSGPAQPSAGDTGSLQEGQTAVYRDRDRDNLNIRQSPGTDAPIIGKLPYGARIRILEIDDSVYPGWVRGEVMATGQVGWMACRNPSDGYQLIRPD